MRQRFLLMGMILLSISITTGVCQSKRRARKRAAKERTAYVYELNAVAEGVVGNYLVEVWSYSNHPDIAIEQSKKNAVHGILFKGYPGKNDKGLRITPQEPIIREMPSEKNKKKFLDNFFKDEGDYMQFVTRSNDGSVAPPKVMKLGRKRYKVGVVVSVRKDALRKYMEAHGVVKSLTDGF
ncbi:hypothetical protein K4L44_04950 [Halosquirtibacter laminarini]|uniref:Uncharacterized protein n=1 Tax=Halosquirtibacter laminarini TaxID=3374600 RepID=A0AC61NPP9_9BACT|nr:hypothetical protein K4L44_04950 [Prolixibacteraceae bacterium]